MAFDQANQVASRDDRNPNQLLLRYALAIGMGVEAKGFSAAQNKAAVRGVSGVLGSLRTKEKACGPLFNRPAERSP